MNRPPRRHQYRHLLQLLHAIGQPETPDLLSLATSFPGFGALKELLLPLDNRRAWSPTDLQFEPDVQAFHKRVNELFPTGYEATIASLRNSMLTSFFTPSFITDPIVESIKSRTTSPLAILEPAAGTGSFITALKNNFSGAAITAIEKDMLTAMVLAKTHPDVETIHAGFEEFKNRDFDLVISNIPFGNVSVYDDRMFREAIPAKVKATTRIHNYFLVKSLDNLREGGLLTLVTTSGFMDSPGNRDIRDYAMKNADIISLARLPNNVFENAGTYPVTDIVTLRKNTRKRNLSTAEKQFTESVKFSVPDDKGLSVEVNLNAFYVAHPGNVLGTLVAGGQYHGNALDVKARDGMEHDALRPLIRKLLDEGWQQMDRSPVPAMGPVTTNPSSALALPLDHPDAGILKQGSLVIINGKVGTIEISDDQKLIKTLPAIRDAERVSLYIQVRNTLARLVKAELDGDDQKIPALRLSLNERYDHFVFQYGPLSHPANKKLLACDADGFKVLSLERSDNGHYTKADIFSRQIHNVKTSYGRPESVRDALLLSLNAQNGVDITFISRAMSRPENEVLREALDQELIFFDIHSKGDRYVTRDEFLSGNVVGKLKTWETARTNSNIAPALTREDVHRHIEHLKEAQPVFLKRELIDLNIGERWIPVDIYENFASQLFNEKTEIKYLESTDQYLVNVKAYSNEENITYAATTHSGKITGSKILEHAMADTQPYLQVRVADTNPPQFKPDLDGMKNVEMKIREIKQEFEKFITDNPPVAQRIETLYNTAINNSVRRTYDGSHLQLATLKHFSPRAHQKDATWMLLQQDGGIVDHKVGAGKTLVIITTAMEMRRLGIARKPLIICMKANVASIAEDFRRAYPTARILAPDPQKEFTRQKRQHIFATMAANDWDAVILTHEMFQAIPQSPHIKKKILQQELTNLEDDLKVISGNRSLSKRVLKGLEGRKQNLTVRIQLADAAIQRDENILDFQKIGFDHLFVDESQAFKNLHFTTRHQQVAGLGDPAGSLRALNLEFAIRTIQERKGGDKGITFLSGTTISNSLVELYLLFKYLRPERISELKINSFDAWAKMYARKSATYEFTVTNELKMKERYREFIKVPELARFYAEVSHVVTDSNLNVDKPRVENIVVNLEPTTSQQNYTEKLIRFSKTRNPTHVNLTLNDKEMNAYMLIATNLARKMSIDMRLVDPAYAYEPEGKVARLCQTVADEYRDSNDYKGTQLVFCDVGTPGGSGFNLYAEIKRVLVDQHQIPPEEIQFIHDHDARTKKEQLFRDVNQGNIRVLIGSTRKLGTGVNVQERIIAMHHLDIPWRPSDFEQRTGRGGRQGNTKAKEFRQNVVRNYIFAVNRTLDAYQFNILSNKQKFISQIKDSSINLRKIDEGALDQEGGMNFGEYVALLSGNTDLLEKVKLEKKLADLERSYHVFLKRQSEANFYIDIHSRECKGKEDTLHKLEDDWKPMQAIDLEKAPIYLQGIPLYDRRLAGEQLHQAINNMNRQGLHLEAELARCLDFQLIYHPVQNRVYVKTKSGVIINMSEGKLNDNPALAGRYLIDAVKRLPKLIEQTRASIFDIRNKLAVYRNELAAEFRERPLIVELKQQIEQLSARVEKAFAQQPELVEERKTKPSDESPAQNTSRKGIRR